MSCTRDKMATSEPRKGQAVCMAKALPAFLSYLKLEVLVQPWETNP